MLYLKTAKRYGVYYKFPLIQTDQFIFKTKFIDETLKFNLDKDGQVVAVIYDDSNGHEKVFLKK
ncbi:hypothetical protein [Litchfieldia alkalitelluris]|uniref:hypothetical protein n=1 Tax=Litchfieldia alkalitelluris TaxID=304268 RepID=UPI00195AAC0E|nr:hypothetical protein [Litchfieldia alkalitelluris]